MVYRCVYIYTSDMFATNITFKLVSRSGEFPFCDNYAGENDDKPLELVIILYECSKNTANADKGASRGST